jgi:formylglycine-generating enzyme required for sulfatase activity
MANPEMATPETRSAQSIEPAMRSVPEGWFLMGCDDGRDDERPAHRVWVDAFELAAFQTTNADYARFLQATNHPLPLSWDDPNFSKPEQPVAAASWFDAVAYCDWLSRAAGKQFRLPTEAQWERAARGGVEGEPYPWGHAAPEDLPNYRARWKSGPEPVGLYAPNVRALQLGDNVHEWCSDWYDPGYYTVSPERNSPASGSRRASRGGSWRHHIKVTRTPARQHLNSSTPIGVRVAAVMHFRSKR